METLDKVLEILMDLDDEVDYKTEEHLIDDRILDSFSVISLVGELEEAFDIRIDAVNMTADNFNSAGALSAMVDRLKG